MKTKILKLNEIKPGNLIVRIKSGSDTRELFLVGGKYMANIIGFSFQQLLENPSRIAENLEFKSTFLFGMPHDIVMYPTKNEVEEAKNALRKQIKELFIPLLEGRIASMNAVPQYGVVFRDKSEWQKDDCITGCGAESTLEAVHGNAMVRCCEKSACKKQAARIAKHDVGAIMLKTLRKRNLSVKEIGIVTNVRHARL